MTVTGKPQKFLMRNAMVEELGLVNTEDGLRAGRLDLSASRQMPTPHASDLR